MNKHSIRVRHAFKSEFSHIGQLMVNVYSQLKGFPKESEQASYYDMLRKIGEQVLKPETELLVAADSADKILGAVVFFGDIQYYGSGGIATQAVNTSGFRLLAVDPVARGQGIGKLLTEACLQKAKNKQSKQMIIHTTLAMKTAWMMYEKLGFIRSEELDFKQGDLAVYGFKIVF